MITVFVVALALFALSGIGAVVLVVWLTLKKWEQIPVTPQEKTVLLFIFEHMPNLRVALILFTVIFLISGTLVVQPDSGMWVFFVGAEIFLILTMVSFERIKKIIGKKLSFSPDEPKKKLK